MDSVDPEAAKKFFPEGMEVNDEALTGFLSIVNESNSRGELVEKLIGYQANIHAQAEQSFNEVWTATQTEWRDGVKADKEYGGENFDKSLAVAKSVIKTYARDAEAMQELLTLTGAGNNIHMVALLNRIAAAVPMEGAPAQGTAAPASQSAADLIFNATPKPS